MTSFKTNKGSTYCVTVPSSAIVSGSSATITATYVKNGKTYTVTLVDAEEPGQYYFCAPCWQVNLSSEAIDCTIIVGGGSGVGGGAGSGGGTGSDDGFIPEEATETSN